MIVFVCILLALAAIPAILFTLNLPLFRQAPAVAPRAGARVSVLIPARNEESSIERSVRAVLASTGIELELLVLDDQSEDRTHEIVTAICSEDSRLRLLKGSSLPSGWCGKQYACSTLAGCASNDLLCFLDADVVLTPDALARTAEFLQESNAELVSGFPRQQTVTFLEKLVLPLIHFVLLGYLPIFLLRSSTHPGYAAGCGQFMMVRRETYLRVGGHACIRTTLHDGIRLPKAFRQHGYRTDIFDAGDIARCRMYRNAAEVWNGLAKNAVEGMAAPERILIFTVLLFGGEIAPFFLAAAGVPGSVSSGIAVFTCGLALYPRIVAAWRFRQSVVSAMLHPLGVAVLLGLQWYALIRHLLRRPASWKGRAYGASPTNP